MCGHEQDDWQWQTGRLMFVLSATVRNATLISLRCLVDLNRIDIDVPTTTARIPDLYLMGPI